MKSEIEFSVVDTVRRSLEIDRRQIKRQIRNLRFLRAMYDDEFSPPSESAEIEELRFWLDSRKAFRRLLSEIKTAEVAK